MLTFLNSLNLEAKVKAVCQGDEESLNIETVANFPHTESDLDILVSPP
jgi:hypothetical protein